MRKKTKKMFASGEGTDEEKPEEDVASSSAPPAWKKSVSAFGAMMAFLIPWDYVVVFWFILVR